MNVGVVGSEGAKFTELGHQRAVQLITSLLTPGDVVVSGGCHLGGIDIWAEEIADLFGFQKIVFKPKELSWSGGYKPRNLLIAQHSDIVHSITIDKFPAEYVGMKFPYCYHCKTEGHIKSGGCYTMKQAVKLGKQGKLHVVENF